MRRILWLTEHYPPGRGGMAQSCDRIVRGLRAAGTTIDVAWFTRRAVRWQTRREDGGQLFVVPLGDDPQHALRRFAEQVTGRVSGQTPGQRYTHLVAFGGLWPVLAAPVLAAWLEAPLVTLLRGNDLDVAVFSPRQRPALVEALRASSRVCVVARSHARLVSALVPQAEVSWVRNGIDADQWKILPSEQDRASRWLIDQVDPDRRVIGLIGQLKRKKGVAFLLEALAATGIGSGVHLMLVGEVEPEVTARLAVAGTPHTVLPFRDRDQLPEVYARCDVVALPSFYDGLPNVALEAAALGVPLLASDAGGLADLVDDTIGFTFRAGDPAAARDALQRFSLADRARLAALGEAAAARVRHDFTPALETAGYLAVFDEVRAGRPHL